MVEQEKQRRPWPAVLIAVAVLGFVVIWSVLTPRQAKQTETTGEHQHSPFGSFAEDAAEANRPRPKLSDVIKYRSTWNPVYQGWSGKAAPDFTLTDITGKVHKLSDYRGKDVLIIFWATWCRPCLSEIPHLIALRNIESKDKLAMLAISNEHSQLVKRFAAARRMNYTVIASYSRLLPEPYNSIRAIPCSFFINADGKIKLATEGTLTLGEIKAIFRAE